jgi:ribonucleoside-diphosphate reductase alpha chain
MIGLSRLISLSARAGVSIENIVDQLNSCGVCPSYATRKATKGDTSPGSCCPIAVGKALKEMYEELNSVKSDEVIPNNAPKCPKCGAELINEGGCNICKNCGWSKCD